MESAVKFIRARLMEGCAESEARQDFDAKLTPIRYEDLRHTQGESHTRLQMSTSGRPPFVTPRRHDHRPNLSSLALTTQQPLSGNASLTKPVSICDIQLVPVTMSTLCP